MSGDNRPYQGELMTGAKLLDFKELGWWGKDYGSYLAEVERMKVAGWTIFSAEPEKEPTRIILMPPVKK